MIEEQELETRIVSVPDRAKGLVIRTNEQLEEAGEVLRTIKSLRAEIDDTFDSIIEKAHAAHKEAIAKKRKVDAPLVEAEGILKPKISAYIQEQERVRRQEELRLQKLAQEEAERLALETAVSLEEIGESAQAEILLREPIIAAPVILQKATPKVAGISTTTYYSANVTNLMELVKAVAIGRVPVQCLQANGAFLNAQARVMKDAMSYPGVALVKTGGVSAQKY